MKIICKDLKGPSASIKIQRKNQPLIKKNEKFTSKNIYPKNKKDDLNKLPDINNNGKSPIIMKRRYVNKLEKKNQIKKYNHSRNNISLDKSKNTSKTVNFNNLKNKGIRKFSFHKQKLKIMEDCEDNIDINIYKSNQDLELNKKLLRGLKMSNFKENNKSKKYLPNIIKERQINANSLINVLGSYYKLFNSNKILTNFNNLINPNKDFFENNNFFDKISVLSYIEKKVIIIQRIFKKYLKRKREKIKTNNYYIKKNEPDIFNISLSEEDLSFSEYVNKEGELIEISSENEEMNEI